MKDTSIERNVLREESCSIRKYVPREKVYSKELQNQILICFSIFLQVHFCATAIAHIKERIKDEVKVEIAAADRD